MTIRHAITAPTVVSMLICDQVIDDKITNKKSAIGLFNMVLVPRVPTVIPNMAILASVTEITSRVELELRLVRDTDNELIFQTRGPVDAPDPLATVDLIFGLQGLQLKQAGQHAFEILHEGEILARRRFIVRTPPRQESEETPGADGGATQ